MLTASTLLRRQAAQWSASAALRTQTSRRFVAVAMESRVAHAAERIPVQVHAIAQKRRRQMQRDHLFDQWLQRQADQLCRLPRVLATSPAKAHKSRIKRIAKWFRVLLHLWKLMALSAPLVITAPLVLSTRTLAPSIEKQWWEYASWAAQRSTPAMMKFLQWASTRRDMFPASFCDRFESFHENAPVHTWKETEQVLRMAFGRKWREQLDIESEPIGSGCIAQVYKGKLRATGEDVAVKVIHPHVKELVALDLDLMRAAVWMIERIPRLRLLSARESVDEFAQLMDRQLNLRVEAENLVQFSNHFRNRPRGLRFPKPQMEYTTESVLIESYESGVHFHQLDSHINVKDRRAIARVVLESYLRMVFLDNFAHGDLHPGNLLFDVPSSDQSKSRHAAGVTAIDAGIVTRLEPEDLRNFVELFHAVATGNGYKAGQLIVSRSKPVGVSVDAPAEEKCTDLESFCKGMDRIVTNALSWRLKLQNVQVGALLREVMELCCNHQVKLEGKYASIVISIGVLEGVGRKLDPDLDVLSVALPIIVQSLVRNVWK